MPTQIITSVAQIDGIVSKDFKAKSGRQNFMSSLNLWLSEVVAGGFIGDSTLPAGKDFYWAFHYPLAPLKTPSISVSEVGLFDLGAYAFDYNLVDLDSSGNPIRAVVNQTLVEINCWDQDSDSYGGATKKVYEMRDRVVFALEYAGTPTNAEDGFIIAPIKLLDFTTTGRPFMSIIRLDTSGNAINEKFLVDPVVNQLKRFKLLVRFLYTEYKDPL